MNDRKLTNITADGTVLTVKQTKIFWLTAVIETSWQGKILWQKDCREAAAYAGMDTVPMRFLKNGLLISQHSMI